MYTRSSAARRTMWLAVAISTVLCVVGTVLVFVAPVAGFGLLFISFCVFSVVPFLAFGVLGPADRDRERQRPADDGSAGRAAPLVRAAGGHRPPVAPPDATPPGHAHKRRRR